MPAVTFLFENGRHFFVAEAPARPDGPVGETDVRLLALGIELDLDGFDVAQLSLLQAGQAVGDDLREHRDDLLRQVHAGGAFARFDVRFGATGRFLIRKGAFRPRQRGTRLRDHCSR